MPIFNSNVYTGKEAKDMLMRGVDIVADAVKTTLGARGSNAILQEPVQPFHVVTNDGVSIAEKVRSHHPVENIGVGLMKEVASRANNESGDGTTTAVVLAQAILRGGMDAGAKGIEVMRSLNECLPIIEAAIDDQKRDITVDEVEAVATVSGESKELGAMLQKIYQEIGPEGIIELDNSGTFETAYSVTEGVRLRGAGFVSQHMATEGSKAVYKNPKVLVVKQRIATLTDIDGIFAQLSKDGTNELVMFVDDIDQSVLAALAYTHARGIFKTLIIKAPTLWKDWLFEDLAKITGATVVEPSTGVTLKTVGLVHLGTCEKLTTTKDETVVVGIKDISGHVKALEADENPDTRLRVSWLKTKAATLRLGASSDSELSYKRLKAEDARNASWLALKHGVVPGGGVALYNAADKMPDTIGGNILRKALRAPIRQIMLNAGETESAMNMLESRAPSVGYDANTRELVDMWEAGIVDPTKVVKNSVRNAISVAGTVLTAETITIIPKEV